MLNLDEDTCKKIAEAIVERWTANANDKLRIMEIVFKAEKPEEAARKVTNDLFFSLYDLKDDSFFWLLHKIRPHITDELQAEWEEFQFIEQEEVALMRKEAQREADSEQAYYDSQEAYV